MELTSIFSAGAEYFYFIVCLLAIEFFRQFRMEMEAKLVEERTHPSLSSEMESILRNWKERYCQLTRLVDCINQCSNLLVLQLVILYFVLIMNGIFFTSTLFKNDLHFALAINVYYVTIYIFYLVTITYLPSKLKSEVKIIQSLVCS